MESIPGPIGMQPHTCLVFTLLFMAGASAPCVPANCFPIDFAATLVPKTENPIIASC